MTRPGDMFPVDSLGRLFNLEYGAALPEQSRSGNGYPVFGSAGIVGYHHRFLVEGPAIVAGRKGSVGEIRWSESHFWPIDTAYYVVPKDGSHARYLYWLLSSIDLKRLDAATGVPGLNRNDVYDLREHVAPHVEQRRIAAVLDTVDAAIAKIEAVIAKLKQIRAGLLHDLLTRGLDHNGQLRDPVRHPEQFKDSPLGRIPKEWEVGGVRQMADNCDARRIPVKQSDRDQQEGTYPYYGASGVIDYVDDYLFEGKHVLVAEDGENLRSRHLPVAFIASGKFWVNNHAHIFKPLPSTDVQFLEIILESQNYEPWLIGSAQPKLTQKALEGIPLVIPPKDEQECIAAQIANFDRKVNSESNELRKMQRLKSALMSGLLTGCVRVPDRIVPTEPAP